MDNAIHSPQKKILIVEDEQVLMQPLDEKLTRHNFSVIKAYNGKEGLDKALTLHPDLILLDIVMPVLDGISMLKKLREDEWGKSVPVVILSNLSEVKLIKEGEENLVLDYLIKSDWTLDDLAKKVEETLK